MKLIVTLLLIAAVSCVDIQQQSFAQVATQSMQELSQSNIGKFIMDLAELHSAMRGPLEDILATIQNMTEELQEELKQLDANYQRRSNQHERTVIQLQQNIGATDIEISNSRDKVDNVLVPVRVSTTTPTFLGPNLSPPRPTGQEHPGEQEEPRRGNPPAQEGVRHLPRENQGTPGRHRGHRRVPPTHLRPPQRVRLPRRKRTLPIPHPFRKKPSSSQSSRSSRGSTRRTNSPP